MLEEIPPRHEAFPQLLREVRSIKSKCKPSIIREGRRNTVGGHPVTLSSSDSTRKPSPTPFTNLALKEIVRVHRTGCCRVACRKLTVPDYVEVGTTTASWITALRFSVAELFATRDGLTLQTSNIETEADRRYKRTIFTPSPHGPCAHCKGGGAEVRKYLHRSHSRNTQTHSTYRADCVGSLRSGRLG